MVNTTVLKLECASESPGGFFKHNLLNLTLQISDSIGLRWNPINSIANKFSADTDVAGLKSQVENH